LQVYCTDETTGEDMDFTKGTCIADEHFVATLLGVYEQHEESTIAPYDMPLTHLVFPPGHHHPTTLMSGHFQQGIDSMKCGHWSGCATAVATIARDNIIGLFLTL
jgi:hypothetical protein